MLCSSEEAWVDFLEERVAKEDAARMDEHLRTCDMCQAVVERIAANSSSLDEIREYYLRHKDDIAPNDNVSPGEVLKTSSDRRPESQVETRSFLRDPVPETDSECFEENRHASDDEPVPESIGRYKIERLLGSGGFGRVFLANDEKLKRKVALKLARRPSPSEPTEEDLAEAQAVASLDHPNIVPVYDVGESPTGAVFIVSKYIDGETLAARIRRGTPSMQEAVALVARVAAALHFAHSKGLVHRDIKPGNILIDSEDAPYVCDFGLALKEENYGKGPQLAGTLRYMSPEQARRDGHHVDGRTDIYSLGVVLYELLTGKTPFPGRGETLLNFIATQEVRPPRQFNHKIPQDLERICLKSLANRLSDRYTTALDFSEELRAFESTLEAGSSKTEDSTGKTKAVQQSVVLAPIAANASHDAAKTAAESAGKPTARVSVEIPPELPLAGRNQYARKLVDVDEKIVGAAESHPVVFFVGIVGVVITFAPSLFALLSSTFLASGSGTILYSSLILLPLLATSVFKPALSYFTTELVITDRRIIADSNVYTPSGVEIPYQDFDAMEVKVDVSRDFIGRHFGYGTVTIKGKGLHQSLTGLRKPFGIKRLIEQMSNAAKSSEDGIVAIDRDTNPI